MFPGGSFNEFVPSGKKWGLSGWFNSGFGYEKMKWFSYKAFHYKAEPKIASLHFIFSLWQTYKLEQEKLGLSRILQRWSSQECPSLLCSWMIPWVSHDQRVLGFSFSKRLVGFCSSGERVLCSLDRGLLEVEGDGGS